MIDKAPSDYKSPTWEYVQRFAWQMELKLASKRHKGARDGWMAIPRANLFDRLADEMAELKYAMGGLLPASDVVKECADVGNFAMMIADVTTALEGYNKPIKP